jgi:pimeloyl-ACP methyl ester carboxylesterase
MTNGMSVASPRIEASPSDALVDTPVQVRLVGLAPARRVILRARLLAGDGSGWESAATFRSDASGEVDLSAQAPESGSYDGVEPMGFIWSMTPAPGAPDDRRLLNPTLEPTIIELGAEVDGQSVAETRLTRRHVALDVRRTDIREGGIVATLFEPPGERPFPTLVVLGGSGGGLPDANAALLASHGFAALSLAYFRAEDLPPELLNIPLEYFETAIGWLMKQDFVLEERIGAVGGSRGAELALLLASRHPEIRVVVGTVPSSHLFGAVARSETFSELPQAAWTYQGTPLPFLTQVRHEELEADEEGGIPLTPAYLASLDDIARARAAEIPVERINGPILLISGQDDHMWPSSVFGERIMERLAEHRHPFLDEHLTYNNCGHTLGAPYGPTTVRKSFHPVRQVVCSYGGTPRGIAHAREDSWPKILRFLDTHLKGDG